MKQSMVRQVFWTKGFWCEVTAPYHCSLLLQAVVREVQAGSNPVCKLWSGLCEVSSLPYTALAGVDIAAAGSKLALAQESTSVSSNGPMRVGWGWEQQCLEQYQGATVTDPSLSWIKLLVSSWGSSSGVIWDQLPMLSSLLALIERLSLFTTAATATAGLSLSLLGRANRKMVGMTIE